MGNTIGVPIGYAARRTLASENGFLSGLKEVVAHSYLEKTYKAHKRFDLYNPLTDDLTNLEAINFAIPHVEETSEHRRQIREVDEADSIFICGFNSSGEKLIVRISQIKHGLASAWLFLYTKDGTSYSLPDEKLYRVPIRTGPESFSAGGLRLRCLLPMRKWRVSFSGLLKEQRPNSSRRRLVFVKFSFLWSASSFIYDLGSDIPTKMLANLISKEKWTGYAPDLKWLSDKLDSYVQGGNLVGTYRIDGGDDLEMYLWGARKRSLERISHGTCDVETEYFAYFLEGEMLHFRSLSIPGSNENCEKLYHGVIVQGNSLGGPLEECLWTENNEEDVVSFRRGAFTWKASFTKSGDCIDRQNSDESSSTLTFSSAQLGEQTGQGVIIKTSRSSQRLTFERPRYHLSDLDSGNVSSLSLVLSLKQPSCRDTSLTGGKGSSLADLHQLSSMDGTFSVPKGVVVTSAAYEEFLKAANLEKHISSLELAAWKNTPVGLQDECARVSTIIGQSSLPVTVKQAIHTALTDVFGKDLDTTRLAVRSSASGEDSEEMSAAGQMKTFLGVKGLEMVYANVVKCWASQFDFTAVQYKRQNGQPLNSPMAVVIQEMVPAEVAGVMFTCDPVNGNPARITITSNYGIGESVVSASAEPDTIVISRSVTGQCEVDSVQVGAKKNMTVMTETGVAEEEMSEDFSSQCSLASNLAKQLANIGILVEEAYGCLVDIEWAIKDNHIYLLQARPVTTFDKETDFELFHECDSPIRGEDEWMSTANVGEVMSGAMTHLGMTSLNKILDLLTTRIMMKRNKHIFPWNPYYQQGMVIYAHHLMFNVLDTMLRFYHGKHTAVTSSQNLSFFGRILKDPDMLERASRRNKYYASIFAPSQLFYMISDLMNASSRLVARRKAFPVGSKLEIPTTKTAEELYMEICRQWTSLNEPMKSHMECSFYSSFSSTALISVLSGGSGEMNTEAFGDLAYILSNCSQVESVEVPNAVENLARVIMKTPEGNGFLDMDPREALMWLERTDSQAGAEFKNLLKNHGHRCLQEFDLYSKSWGNDPIPLVKSIQEMAAKGIKAQKTKAPESTVETIKHLAVPLSWKQRLTMRLIIPFCRKAVALREGSKSLLINLVDCMRHSYRRLASQMVAEGRLPEEELLYFLTHYEVLQLIRTRSSNLIQKAIRRRGHHSTLNKWVFPEMSRGIPKPMNFEKKETVREGSLKMIGVPVSQGSATGIARVATSVEEASQLQPGEILIAYSTDIGWSPYFPMLGGVATELGGLVSHGAVVAREYGLPCVVGVIGATMKFNTGDKVYIDGTKGLLYRLDD